MTTEDFNNSLAAADVSPLWNVMANLVTETPRPAARPHLWRYADMRPLLVAAGEAITAEQAERRVLILENPGIPGGHRTTDSLYAGLQLVLPGEVAPAHRHTQSAMRFVFESEGAWTAVDGDKVVMHPFDLVLTPNWRWHEHGGEGAPAIWLDGLDIPIISHFSAGFAEREGNAPAPDSVPPGISAARWGSNLKPIHPVGVKSDHPLFHYPFAQWRQALTAHAGASDPDTHCGHVMEFVNPVTGGAVMSTLSAFAHHLPAGMKTRPYRQSAGAVFTLVEGSATLTIDGTAYALEPRDVIAVPSWAALEIHAGSEPAVLFSYSDRTCHEKLGLWREQRD
ncbi:cupin domain-containing protein [Cucumibacter marinus]|uniref:cupin domain-containing protein n=1 Tax=Cucumibacter marinus TaxID=1121252 RepID=UPI00041B38DE|nr:cupin domain-containing protein [Cucumibacter marinus]